MADERQGESKTYEFTLILGGPAEVSEATADALFVAGCDDATLGTSCGVAYLDFAREGASFRDAVLSAIADVERSGAGFRVARVEPDELVTTAEVARRLGRSRETIRLYALGERGPGDFPSPVAGVRRHAPLYRWADVAWWIQERLAPEGRRPGGDAPVPPAEEARTVGAINAALDLRRYVAAPGDAVDLLRSTYPAEASAKQPSGRGAPGRRGRAKTEGRGKG